MIKGKYLKLFVPNLIINVPEINEFYLGKLIYFFEKACGISGYLLGVNFQEKIVNIDHWIAFILLAAIGLNTSFAKLKKSGIRPMIHGFIISALVVIVALAVEMAMGLV